MRWSNDSNLPAAFCCSSQSFSSSSSASFSSSSSCSSSTKSTTSISSSAFKPYLPSSWLLQLVLVGLLASCWAAPAGVLIASASVANSPSSAGSRGKTSSSSAGICGTVYTDTESSTLLADVVLEGRVREKIRGPQGDRYNVSIQVRKRVWKGKELVNGGKRARKLLLGTFQGPPDAATEDTSTTTPATATAARRRSRRRKNRRRVTRGSRAGGRRRRAGGKKDSAKDSAAAAAAGGGGKGDDVLDINPVNCVGDVRDGATYIFFLKDVGDKKGRYFQISALPIKKNRRQTRIVSKILKPDAAQKPQIQNLRGPKSVTKGSTLTLRCKGKARPKGVYTWYHNDQVIKPGKWRRIKTSKSGRSSRLKIPKASTDNSGVYTCRVSNAVGDTKESVTISVDGGVKLSDQTYTLHEYMNEDANATDYVSVTASESIHTPCQRQNYYCFNGGTCRYITALQQQFCQCPERWAGNRCEILDIGIGLDNSRLSREARTLMYERILIVVGIVIALLVFVVICIASYFLAKRRRKRWEAKRQMKRNAEPESHRLLDKDGVTPPQFTPGYRPIAQKQTQTDNETFHPPEYPPPERNHDESELNFIINPTTNNHPNNSNPENFFRDHSYPLFTAAPTQDNSASNGQQRPPRPLSDQLHHQGLERRGSRSRLKAVSVDDNCRDRPKSWKPEAASAAPEVSMPVIDDGGEGVDPPENIEMSNMSPERKPKFLDDAHTQFTPTDDVDGGDESRERGEDSDPQTAPPAPPPDYYSVISPLIEKEPKEGETPNHRPDTSLSPPPPSNGVPQDWDSDDDDEEEQALPYLHISEEDLNGNVSKPDSFDSEFLPPPPPPLEPELASSSSLSSPTSSFPPAPPRSKELLDGVTGSGDRSPCSGSEDDDSAGFLPRTLSSNEATSPLLDGGSPQQGDMYSFDPCMDSDPNDFEDQFMHGSPRKGSAGCRGTAEDKQDYERRLVNVQADQEAIPI